MCTRLKSHCEFMCVNVRIVSSQMGKLSCDCLNVKIHTQVTDPIPVDLSQLGIKITVQRFTAININNVMQQYASVGYVKHLLAHECSITNKLQILLQCSDNRKYCNSEKCTGFCTNVHCASHLYAGYYYGTPLPLSAMAEWLARRTPWSCWRHGEREVVSSIPGRGNIVGWVFHPSRWLERFSLIWICLSFQILNSFRTLSSWGSINYKPSALLL